MSNEQLQQFFIQQAATAAAAAALFSSFWNGQQPPAAANQHMGGGPNNQQVQSQQGGDQHDLTSSATNTGNNSTSLSSAATNNASQQLNTQNPLEALLATAGSPVNLAALMQSFQKQQQQQQQDSTNSTANSLASCFNMPDQQQATALAAALRSSSSHSANNSAGNNNVAALNALPSVLQHQLNNLISSPSNHSQHNNNQQGSNKLQQQLNNSGSTSSSPSSLTNHQQQQHQPTTTNKSQQSTAYHHYQNNANTRSSANSKSISGNNQAINNQQMSHSINANTTNTNTSLDGGKIEVGLNMTTTALSSSTPNQMQSSHTHSRAPSSPVTNIQAPINVASQHHKTSSSSSHHQSSHKQSVSTNSPREPISSSVLAKNNVGLPRKLVRGQDVWLGRGVEQTRQILKCMWCGQSCRTLADLSQHMKETQHYTNIVSQEQITSWRTPDNDLAQSQVNQVFTCKVCDEAFSSLNELSNHMVKKSHYNGQPMNSPIGNYSLVGGESNSAHMINQQHLLTTTTSTTNRKSPSLLIPDMQSVGQVNSHKKQRNSSFYNDYDQSASPPMTSNSTKERRKKSLPVRKLLELERKGSATVSRHNQSKNDLISDNISGIANQDSDCDDNGRDNSSMALMSRMLDRQESTLAYNDNDHLGMSDDETGQYRDDANSGSKGYGAHSSDSKVKKRHNDYDDEGDDSSGNLDRSPRGRLGQSQLSPGMSDHESMHSSTSVSYRNQIHIDTTNLTSQCNDCHNHQKKSSCRQKCRSCSNPQPVTTGSTLYKPGTVGRQLLASLMNNKLDPDQLDEDLLNRPLMYDSNGDVVINLDGRYTSAQTKSEPNSESKFKSSKNEDDPDKNSSVSKSDETGDESTKQATESDEIINKDQQQEGATKTIKTEKNDDNKCSQIDPSDSGKSDIFQDIKETRPQTLSAVSPSDQKNSKAKMFGNTSSLSALEMLVEKSFDPKTRRGAQNTGILQRLGIDEEICPPWQHMNYASWYAAAAASYGGIPGNPMAAMSGLSGYPLPPGMPMSMGSLGNVPNSSRSHNNITPLSGQGASMTSPMRTPSSSPPTNTSSPHSSSHQHSSHNKSVKSMSLNPSINNLQIEASSSPSLNSLMATTHQQLQSLASSSMQYQSPHSSPTAASLSSTKGSASSSAGRNSKRSFQNMQDDDFNDSPPKPTAQDNSSKQASRRAASSSSSRNSSSMKGSKKAKLNVESSAINSNQTTSNRYPRRSKTSTTLNKLKQQLESESEDDFEDYDNEQEPVSLAMKKSTKSDTTASSVQQQEFQQNPLQQLQQLQLQLQTQQLQQQQLPREDVNEQSLAAMQATFLLKQLMTQAMASMVTGNQVQPTPDLASVQQYLLGSMLNQNQNQAQPKQTHADNIQQSKKKSAKRSFSDDIDEEDKEGLSDDGDCVDFTSSANVQQQYRQQQNKSSSRGRKSTAKKVACKKSSAATKQSTQSTSSSSTVMDNQQHVSNQQDISNTGEVPVKHDEKYTVAPSEEQDLADHSLLKQEKSESISRRRKQHPKKDTDNSEVDDDDGNAEDDDDDVKDNDSGQLQITGQEDHSNRVLHDEQEEVADSDDQSSRKSIIGKINVDNDLNDSTATELNVKKRKKEEGDQLLLCDDRAEDHDESNNDNIDQDKNYRHHEKSIGGATKTILNQKQTVVSRNDAGGEVETTAAASDDEKEQNNILEPSNTGNNECETNAQSAKIPSAAAYEISEENMVNEKQHQSSNSSEALPSQEITDNLNDDEQNTNNEDTEKEINTDQSNKLQINAESASSEDDVEDLSASIQSKEKSNQSRGRAKNRDNTSDCHEMEENCSSEPDQDNYCKLAASVDDVSRANNIVSNIVDEHGSRHCGLSGINHDDLTSSDDDNEGYSGGNYMASASPESDQNRSPKNRHNQQQQTVLGQVGKTNGDTKSILEVKP